MQRIICDIYSKDNLRLWEHDVNSPSTREFNRRITAVNNMYAWLYEKGILENVSFKFKDYSDVTHFAFDTNDLLAYREEMEKSDAEDAALAVQHIFDVEYTPCKYSGAIELTWTMQTYREVDGCVGRSWENSLVQGLQYNAIADLPYISADKGTKEAVKVLFERCEFEPSDLVKSPGLYDTDKSINSDGTDWVLTDPDDLQLRRQPNASEPKVFELIQVDIWPMEEKTVYKLAHSEFDLNDYSDEEIASMLDSYGYNDMASLISAAGSENEAYGQLAEMFMEVYSTECYVRSFDSWNAAVNEVEQRTGVGLAWLKETEKPSLDNVVELASAAKTNNSVSLENNTSRSRDER